MKGRFLALLHAVALAAVVAAAGGSVGLMLWVGRHNPSSVLLLLFALWVVSPFMGLQLADMFSKRWSVEDAGDASQRDAGACAGLSGHLLATWR